MSQPQASTSLCESCDHQQLVPNTRGSIFSLCRRSRSDPENYVRYPRLPMLQCPGYEHHGDGAANRGDQGNAAT
jgi:hypothetical protein